MPFITDLKRNYINYYCSIKKRILNDPLFFIYFIETKTKQSQQ